MTPSARLKKAKSRPNSSRPKGGFPLGSRRSSGG